MGVTRNTVDNCSYVWRSLNRFDDYTIDFNTTLTFTVYVNKLNPRSLTFTSFSIVQNCNDLPTNHVAILTGVS